MSFTGFYTEVEPKKLVPRPLLFSKVGYWWRTVDLVSVVLRRSVSLTLTGVSTTWAEVIIRSVKARFQHLTNIRSTKLELMLGKCWMQKQSCTEARSNGSNIAQTIDAILTFAAWCEHACVLQLYNCVQMASTPTFSRTKEKLNQMLNESLNRFKLDSTSFQHFLRRFQQCRTTCSNAPNIWLNKVLNTCWSKCWNRLNGPWRL